MPLLPGPLVLSSLGKSDSDVTAWVDGAFARNGRSIDGSDFKEPTSVLWLTVGSYFADIRQLLARHEEPADLDRTQAFSGTISVTGDVVTWCHDLDTMLRPEHHSDAAPVRGSRDEFMEVGEDYAECWVRVDRGQARRAVSEHRVYNEKSGASKADGVIDARVVLVDDIAIAVWSLPEPGGALYRDLGGWTATMFTGSTFDGDLKAVVLALAENRVPPETWVAVAR